MPTMDKKAGYWVGRVRVSGYPTRKKRGFKTKAAAAKWERQEKERLRRPLTVGVFSMACGSYIKYCERRYQLNTYRQKASLCKRLISFLGHDPALDKITTLMISDYLDSRFDAHNGKTANRDLREIKTLFNWLNKTGHYEGPNPARAIERYAEEEFIKYMPPIEDINRVIMVANDKERAFIRLILHTGARRSEILRLKWDDVNFEKATIALSTRKRHGGNLESDLVDMNNTAGAILADLYSKRDKSTPYVFPNSRGGSGGTEAWKLVMPKLCNRAGVKPFGFHSLRHYVAATLADSGKLSLSEIRDQLRHKRSTTTDAYLRSLVREKSRAADILEEAIN